MKSKYFYFSVFVLVIFTLAFSFQSKKAEVSYPEGYRN